MFIWSYSLTVNFFSAKLKEKCIMMVRIICQYIYITSLSLSSVSQIIPFFFSFFFSSFSLFSLYIMNHLIRFNYKPLQRLTSSIKSISFSCGRYVCFILWGLFLFLCFCLFLRLDLNWTSTSLWRRVDWSKKETKVQKWHLY